MTARRSWTDILALGFGASVAMWAVGFFCRIPSGAIGDDPVAPPPTLDLAVISLVPAGVLFALLILCMLAGGFLAGRLTARGWRGGLLAGALSSVLNLLIVFGALGGQERNTLAPSALLFIPGSIFAGALLGALGAAAGARMRPAPLEQDEEADWPWALAIVAACATFLLILVGGLVTSFRAGLQVPDWPNSFGYLMFFYPLSKMGGGIYFEHSHRLLGTLVGLTTLVFAVRVFIAEERRWLRGYALAALGLVVLQGVLGGLRVTGRWTLSDARTDMAPSTALAAVHGIVAQLFFCSLVAWSAFSSRDWRNAVPHTAPSVRTDWRLQIVLLALLALQLTTGAILRHTAHLLHLHLTIAVLTAIVAVAAGVRVWGLYPQSLRPARLAKALLCLLGLQVLLGFFALFTLGFMLERKSSASGAAARSPRNIQRNCLDLCRSYSIKATVRLLRSATKEGISGVRYVCAARRQRWRDASAVCFPEMDQHGPPCYRRVPCDSAGLRCPLIVVWSFSAHDRRWLRARAAGSLQPRAPRRHAGH
jgi:cytochrome c oxidase assembly protein subunit 15